MLSSRASDSLYYSYQLHFCSRSGRLNWLFCLNWLRFSKTGSRSRGLRLSKQGAEALEAPTKHSLLQINPIPVTISSCQNW